MADHSHSARYPPGRAVTKRTLRYYVQSHRIELVFGSVLLGLVKAAHEAAGDDASALTEAELTEGLVAVTQALSLLETTQAHLVVQLDTCATCEREHGLSVGSWLARETGRSHPHRQRQRTDARTLERRRRDRPRQRAGTRAFGPTSPTRCRPRQPRGPPRRRHDPHPDVQRPREPVFEEGGRADIATMTLLCRSHHGGAVPGNLVGLWRVSGVERKERRRRRTGCAARRRTPRSASLAGTTPQWLPGTAPDPPQRLEDRHHPRRLALLDHPHRPHHLGPTPPKTKNRTHAHGGVRA